MVMVMLFVRWANVNGNGNAVCKIGGNGNGNWYKKLLE